MFRMEWNIGVVSNDQYNKIIRPTSVSSQNICSARTFRTFSEHFKHRTWEFRFYASLIKIHNSEFGNNSDGEIWVCLVTINELVSV